MNDKKVEKVKQVDLSNEEIQDQHILSDQEALPIDPKKEIEKILSGLNSQQVEALKLTNCCLLISAGAGSGKTKVIVSKVAYIYLLGLAKFDNILVVTFTNKAARELVSRINQIIPNTSTIGLMAGTFHHISTQILREHAESVGLSSNFTIIDKVDQLRELKAALDIENLDAKLFPVRRIMAKIDDWKNNLLSPDDPKHNEEDNEFIKTANKVYKNYETKLQKSNAVDFGGLIFKVNLLFENNPDILNYYQNRIRYTLVDEYQDINYAQSKWIEYFAKGHNNLTCVGDEDQLIYSWRGANIKYFMNFEKQYENALVVKLETNYRSKKKILIVASNLISHNKLRLGKVLKPATDQAGEVVVNTCYNYHEEAQVIARKILAMKHDGVPFDGCAVLVRTQSLFRILEDKLIEFSIPYQIFGGTKFYEREEIKDCICYLRLINNHDDNFAFDRIYNKPRRNLGKTAYANILQVSNQNNSSYFEALKYLVDNNKLTKKAHMTVSNFVLNIQDWKKLIQSSQKKHSEVLELLIDESGYSAYLQSLRKEEYLNKLDNLKELIRAMNEHESLESFFEHIALISDLDSDFSSSTVKLMTIHSAKGLEFERVFIPSFVENIIPHKRSLEEADLAFALEEERRLIYVALTRAKSGVYISYSKSSNLYGDWSQTLPSRFLNEIKHFNHSFHTKNKSPPSFQVGENCLHSVFGAGCVLRVIGDFVEVRFENEERHNLLAANLKKLIN